jgi:hypothetical protein
MEPDAPPLFSTITDWPNWADKAGASNRATWSTEPPGGKTATNLIGWRVGQACAKAVPVAVNETMSTPAMTASTRGKRRNIGSLLVSLSRVGPS